MIQIIANAQSDGLFGTAACCDELGRNQIIDPLDLFINCISTMYCKAINPKMEKI